MRQRAKRRKTVITTVVLGLMLFLIAGGWAYLKWPDPPMEELRNAAEAISVARDAEAAKYAPELLHETIALFDSAMVHLKTENSRFFLSRDFTRVDFFAREATVKGAQALAKASAKARSVHHTTAATLEDLENMAAEFKRVYAPLPLNKPVRESFNQAVMILSEARLAREKSDYHIAEVKLEKAGRLMRESVKKAHSMLADYFSDYLKWKEWAETAMATSAMQGNTLILVDKMAHRLWVYQNGKIKADFQVELGPQWIGPKLHKGDQATPEGVYKVVQKKERHRTIYYKALLINYPNNDDRARYQRNIADRKISRRLEIGGLIEIHGHGGRGFDWTNGCVALDNKDMDIVFSLARENTPVVIVGSLEPLEKIISNDKAKQ